MVKKGISKENKILAVKKTSYLSAMNNRSIETVRKLQVILSSNKLLVKVKQSRSEIKVSQPANTLYHGGSHYTVHIKKRKKSTNELSVFL